MPADALHVTQMKGFEATPTDQPAQTIWQMQAASEKAAAKKAKAEAEAEAEPTEQSSPDAAIAE